MMLWISKINNIMMKYEINKIIKTTYIKGIVIILYLPAVT